MRSASTSSVPWPNLTGMTTMTHAPDTRTVAFIPESTQPRGVK